MKTNQTLAENYEAPPLSSSGMGCSRLAETTGLTPQAPVLSDALSPQAPRPPRSRNGKIARLSRPYRDMVNRMLRDNISYRDIVNALDECNIRVTERNVSNWKTRGGYAAWRRDEQRALDLRVFQDNLLQFMRHNDASQLPEIGLQMAATHLSEFFLQPEALHRLASDPDKYSRLVSSLCRLSSQIHTLHKYREDSARNVGANPERVRRDLDSDLESIRKIYSSARPADGKSNPIPHHNYLLPA